MALVRKTQALNIDKIDPRQTLRPQTFTSTYFTFEVGQSGTDAIKKFTPSLGIPYLGV